MRKKNTISLSEKELTVLKVIWENEVCTIEDVHEAIPENKDLFITLRLVHKMYDKGVLKKVEAGDLRLYKANEGLASIKKYLEKKEVK
jgi:predicted transcriptional regulator